MAAAINSLATLPAATVGRDVLKVLTEVVVRQPPTAAPASQPAPQPASQRGRAQRSSTIFFQ